MNDAYNQLKDILLLKYYVKDTLFVLKDGEMVYEIDQYEGKHANEYCVYEVKDGVRDGKAELFDDGMVKMRWRMKKGIRDGKYTLYNKGAVMREGVWSDIVGWEEKDVQSKHTGLIMVIRVCGEIIYEGGYNEDMQRDGMGYAYENGVLKRYGRWERDRLVEVKQNFISATEMVEYAEGSTSDLLSHRPIYIGGYQLDKVTGLMKRHGSGRIFNERDGVCEYESEWENGTEIESKCVPLISGCHQRPSPVESTLEEESNFASLSPSSQSRESMRFVVNNLKKSESSFSEKSIFPSEESISLNTLFSSFDCIRELSLADQSLNDDYVKSLIVENMNNLKSLCIGGDSCTMVRQLIINGLESLEFLKISDRSFTLTKTGLTKRQPSGSCFITSCRRLSSIEIGAYCFSDYWYFEVRDLPSLKSLLLRNDTFVWTRRFSLKSDCGGAGSSCRSSMSPVAEAVEVCFSLLPVCCV